MKKLTLSIISVFCLFITAAAQPSTQEVAEMLDEYLIRMEGFGFSGAVLVEKDDQVILRKGYGYANRAKGIEFTADTPFPVQSISKQFTAAAILKLELEGKLSVSDSIGKHFENVPAKKKAITIHHLLTHTSGITRDYAATGKLRREDAVSAILAVPLGNPVGKSMRYNNDGYELLGAIVEKVSGQKLHDFIRGKFFAPLRMTSAGFQGEKGRWNQTTVAHAYNSYVDNGPPSQSGSDWSGYASSDLIISANDLFKWEMSLRKNEILSTEIKNRMFTPYAWFRPDWQYGYGWFVIQSGRGTRELYHGGGDIPRGYTASFTRYRPERMTIIIFANTMIDELGFLSAVKSDITGIGFGKKGNLPPIFEDRAISNPKSYTGTFVADSGETFVVMLKEGQLLIGGIGQKSIDFLTVPANETTHALKKSNNSTLELVRTIPVSDTTASPFRRNIESLEKRLGKFEKAELLGTYPVSETRRVYSTFIKLKFEKGPEVVRFVKVREGTPYPLTGTPIPALTPMRPTGKHQFVAYYPFLKKSVRISFKIREGKDPVTMNLMNGNKSLSARRN